jgi:hypothetical protein
MWEKGVGQSLPTEDQKMSNAAYQPYTAHVAFQDAFLPSDCRASAVRWKITEAQKKKALEAGEKEPTAQGPVYFIVPTLTLPSCGVAWIDTLAHKAVVAIQDDIIDGAIKEYVADNGINAAHSFDELSEDMLSLDVLELIATEKRDARADRLSGKKIAFWFAKITPALDAEFSAKFPGNENAPKVKAILRNTLAKLTLLGNNSSLPMTEKEALGAKNFLSTYSTNPLYNDAIYSKMLAKTDRIILEHKRVRQMAETGDSAF